MTDSLCGVTRRLQALVAIGWDTTTIAQHLGWPTTLLTRTLNGTHTPPPGTRYVVNHLYDQLSMTVGPSEQARHHARTCGWPPPLAWDDEDLDKPDGKPAHNWRRTTRQPFTDRYAEWRDLGYTDLEITHRFGIRPDTLASMLYRAGLPVSPALAEAAHQRKRAVS